MENHWAVRTGEPQGNTTRRSRPIGLRLNTISLRLWVEKLTQFKPELAESDTEEENVGVGPEFPK
ncbi:hypothetical protein G9P44_001968 [Scheffersomyces stipitis]|nr:hypothetical protein G9P44_001968 [Scheffersomyces stipitis]